MRRRSTNPCSLLVVSALLVAAASRAETLADASLASIPVTPEGVSPGASESFSPALVCPTFSWTAVPGAGGYELRVYRLDPRRSQLEPAAALEARLPAGASSWTPAADACLSPGERYAWSVRALAEEGSIATATATARVRGPWSEALLFEIDELPAAAELQRALEVVQRYLGTARVGEQMLGTAEADTPPTRAVAAAEEPRPREQAVGGGPATAVRGEVPDAAGETYGVRGLANSPDGAGVRADNNAGAGADLVLGGSPVAEVTESSFSRDSASNLTFDFTNPGAGTMTLQVDGNPVFHAGNDGGGSGLDADLLDGLDSTAFLAAGTDEWVDESGDTMTGTLTLAAGDIALHTAATVTKDGARFLWDDANASFAAGRGALAANTTGFSNTALGTNALDANSTGGANTAVGRGALSATTVGVSNTAVGASALLSNTAGFNTAVGAAAMFTNTTGPGNAAFGFEAMRNNVAGGANTAIGYRALRNNTSNGNTALGHNALFSNTAGSENTALGNDALLGNTTGVHSTAVGSFALGSNTTGNNNVAVGYAALFANAVGGGNVAIGNRALQSNTASQNTAVGNYALFANTTGVRNTAVGTATLDAVTTAYDNTALGAYVLTANTSGRFNTALGSQAMRSNTTGLFNTAVGASALGVNTTGNSNTAIGTQALVANTTGGSNTAVGSLAMRNTTGSSNTAVGALALYANTRGVNNTALGNSALGANTTAFNNIAIGYRAGYVATSNNNIFIGHTGIAADSGKIRIGTQGGQTEAFIAGIHGNTTAGGIAVFVNAGGELGTSTSSRRFKEDIHRMAEASERLYDLAPVTFRYKQEVVGPGERLREYGLVAEEVAEVLPELVVYDEEGKPYTVRYDQLTPMLVNELQRLARRVERQQAEIAALREERRGRRPPAP